MPRKQIRRFAEEMELRLKANDHKPGWGDSPNDFLLNSLHKNYATLWVELHEKLTTNPDVIIRNAADIANFAMMIADKVRIAEKSNISGKGDAEMKTLKTWEMIKALAENPNLKFKRVGSDLTVGIMGTHLKFNDGNSLLITHDPSGPEFAKGNLTADWELIREPVDFMTAVNSGRNIKPVEANKAEFDRWDYWHLTLDRINGKWYIDD